MWYEQAKKLRPNDLVKEKGSNVSTAVISVDIDRRKKRVIVTCSNGIQYRHKELTL